MELQLFSWISAVVFSLVTAASLGNNCRCVPNQWEGILASTDREFDLRGGNTGSMENNLYVSYDFENKRFAMKDINTGNRAIADYAKGFKYVIRGKECRGLKTDETMRQMCLPDHAEYIGEFTLGTDIPVDMWQFSGPFNVSMKTTVIQKNCMPISEEVYMTKDGFVSLTSSMYLDVTLGIANEDVFTAPDHCHQPAKQYFGPNYIDQAHKRSKGEWSLLNMLQHGMYGRN